MRAAVNYEQELKAKEAAIAKRRELWNAINHFVRTNNKGWLVSPPTDMSLRIECQPSSELPDLLADKGFDLQPLGTGTRIEGGKFVPVLIYRLHIPSLRK